MSQTRGRNPTLAIELTDTKLVVRGTAPCYYVKQLALHAAMDVLRCAYDIAVDLRLEVGVVSPVRLGHGLRMETSGSQNGRS